MAATQISKADAMKLFRRSGIKVQTATPVMVKGADGVERSAFEAQMTHLAEEHILGAARRDDGTAVIVTIDGQRHESRGAATEQAAA